ncbi:TPA: ribosome silencing factor [Candidatus Gastranaerophilales bacterium HUM_9]|nr:MAG TPA: ribosome silencing factor [Candidatus Gastranaerophilales bacterium HUM_9]HBX35020.1 ribosome silencing factor [Cyanobacteria bacterium UBA11440]
MSEITSYKLACVIARILDEKLGKDITILNISNVSSFADYFVICSADASTQVKALTEAVKLRVRELFSRQAVRIENDMKNRWNLLDYSDVVVHILHKEERELYAIEKFWNHAYSVSEEDWLKESEEYSEYK